MEGEDAECYIDTAHGKIPIVTGFLAVEFTYLTGLDTFIVHITADNGRQFRVPLMRSLHDHVRPGDTIEIWTPDGDHPYTSFVVQEGNSLIYQ